MEVTTKTSLGVITEEEEQMQPFSRGPLLPFLTLSLFRSHFHSFPQLLWGSISGGPSTLSIPSPDLAQTSKPAEPNIWEKWRHIGRGGGRGRGVWVTREPESSEAACLRIQVPCWQAQQLWRWLWRHGNWGLPSKSLKVHKPMTFLTYCFLLINPNSDASLFRLVRSWTSLWQQIQRGQPIWGCLERRSLVQPEPCPSWGTPWGTWWGRC